MHFGFGRGDMPTEAGMPTLRVFVFVSVERVLGNEIAYYAESDYQ